MTTVPKPSDIKIPTPDSFAQPKTPVGTEATSKQSEAIGIVEKDRKKVERALSKPITPSRSIAKAYTNGRVDSERSFSNLDEKILEGRSSSEIQTRIIKMLRADKSGEKLKGLLEKLQTEAKDAKIYEQTIKPLLRELANDRVIVWGLLENLDAVIQSIPEEDNDFMWELTSKLLDAAETSKETFLKTITKLIEIFGEESIAEMIIEKIKEEGKMHAIGLTKKSIDLMEGGTLNFGRGELEIGKFIVDNRSNQLLKLLENAHNLSNNNKADLIERAAKNRTLEGGIGLEEISRYAGGEMPSIVKTMLENGAEAQVARTPLNALERYVGRINMPNIIQKILQSEEGQKELAEKVSMRQLKPYLNESDLADAGIQLIEVSEDRMLPTISEARKYGMEEEGFRRVAEAIIAKKAKDLDMTKTDLIYYFRTLTDEESIDLFSEQLSSLDAKTLEAYKKRAKEEEGEIADIRKGVKEGEVEQRDKTTISKLEDAFEQSLNASDYIDSFGVIEEAIEKGLMEAMLKRALNKGMNSFKPLMKRFVKYIKNKEGVDKKTLRNIGIYAINTFSEKDFKTLITMLLESQNDKYAIDLAYTLINKDMPNGAQYFIDHIEEIKHAANKGGEMNRKIGELLIEAYRIIGQNKAFEEEYGEE